jgi:tRNA threonylcarbamoyladenosine modification (KEOPS) complex  Pcc1 subunit
MREYERIIQFTFTFDSEEQATHIARCLQPEIKKDSSQMIIHLTQQKHKLFLRISATHTVMIRAAVNSYLRWIETAYSVHSL